MASYVAKRAAGKKAESMLAPLLESDDESSTGGGSEGSDDSSTDSRVSVVKQTPMQKLKTLAVYLGVGTGVAASGAAMALAPAIAIFVMGGICIANAPYSVFKEREMTKIPSLRSMNNKLREDANDLADNVDALAAEIDDLEPEADRAEKIEENLREIADQQQFNVDKLVNLVKENEEILAQMRDNLRQVIVQDMIAIVVKSDADNSQTFDKSEAKNLALRIRLALQQHNVEFDHVKFLKVIGANATVQGVISIVQKLLPNQPKKKRGEEGGGEESDDGDSDDEDWDDDSDDEEDDIYDMFYLPDNHASTRRTSSGISDTDADGAAGAASPGGAAAGSGKRAPAPMNRRMSLMTCDKRRSLMTCDRRSSRKAKGGRSRKEW